MIYKLVYTSLHGKGLPFREDWLLRLMDYLHPSLITSRSALVAYLHPSLVASRSVIDRFSEASEVARQGSMKRYTRGREGV